MNIGQRTYKFLLLLITVNCLVLTLNCNAQLSNKQGISSISIHPSGTIFTFGLPQSSTIPSGFQQGVFSYFPFPFTAFPINSSVNRAGKTELTGLIGSFDLGLNISKLLKNDRIFRGEAGVYYACIPHSYSIGNDFRFFVNNKTASLWQNTMRYSGLSASATYTTKSLGRRSWGEARNYVQLGIRTMNYLGKSAENQEEWIFNGKGFKIESEVVNQKSFLFFLELGKTYWRRADDMRSLDMGIRIGIPTGSFVSNTFTGYNNNQATGANNILENGAYIGFQMSYHLPLMQLQKPTAKVQKAEKIYCEMERKVIVKHHYKITKNELQIQLFDHENEDGDVVSVCFNGQYLLEKHTLTLKSKVLTLKFLPNQQNVLTVFAHNTGKEGANTSAIRFMLNGKMQEIILYADKKESEGIEFMY
ncbi:hypothetical protein VB796_00265 [Arcicella sp. LKC2W]|uniref:hypothetical protein n=1 Tax=Arcicella sp. LKC2W TaxID=2984198 RepID=UPI002B215704|nr:hypothetical protein [Arcicella sp. LKC2W]MEA5457450.1 hypothetical protein [Arcicella sp. LKC2W]